jgi:hypothetical protein
MSKYKISFTENIFTSSATTGQFAAITAWKRYAVANKYATATLTNTINGKSKTCPLSATLRDPCKPYRCKNNNRIYKMAAGSTGHVIRLEDSINCVYPSLY